MNREDLKATHSNIDAVIKDIATRLADESTPGKPIETERDLAIIMACCTITKSELPESRDGVTSMDDDNMRRWMEQIAEEASKVGGAAYAEILGRLSEFAYEFDEDLSDKFGADREEAERPPEEKPIPTEVRPSLAGRPLEEAPPGASAGEPYVGSGGEPPRFAERDTPDLPEPGSGAFSATAESLEKGEMADGAPIPTPEHVTDEATEGYGFGVMPDDFKKAVRFHTQTPDEETPPIEGWRYSQPTSILVYQFEGRPEPTRLKVSDVLADLKRAEEAEESEDV